MNRQLILTLVAMLCASTAQAQIVVDGTAEGAYGAALSIQDTRTGYGDGATNPDAILTGNNLGDGQNGGSEIDQVFGTISGGRLYVTIAGALEGNFNKLMVFIDSANGGVNQLNGAALPGGLDSFCCGKFAPPKGGNTGNIGALQNMSGMKFDNTTEDPTASADFTADYALIFTNGGERVNENLPNDVQFWAVSAHFADLTQGTAGEVGGLGMQLAPRGEPRVLRSPGDYNKDGLVDAVDYTVWRNSLGDAVTNGTGADGNANGTIDEADYGNWKANYANDVTLAGSAYKPFGNPGNTEALLGPTLPGLAQGELIDRAYALSDGGCTDDSGAGCIAKELEFALDVDPAEIFPEAPATSNASSHRNFNNFVDLRMALNNSNTAGVFGSGGPAFGLVEGEDNPEDVLTGIEFSIPLSEINYTGGNIRVTAMVGNGGFNHLSNQVSGDGVFDLDAETGANIGSAFYGVTPAGSFNNIPGDQFVTIAPLVEVGSGGLSTVPEPTSALIAAVGLLLGGACVRRRG
jgi:hypothetical protein